MTSVSEYIDQVILPKIEKNQGWCRFYAETDVFALLPGAYIIGDEVLKDEDFRNELLKVFSQEHMLDWFKVVEFLPPCDLDGWCLDIIPSKEYLETNNVNI